MDLVPVCVTDDASNAGSSYRFIVLDGHIVLGKGVFYYKSGVSAVIHFHGCSTSSCYLLEK